MTIGQALQGTAHKIKPLRELGEVVSALKSQGRSVVHCHGVFDLIHLGHIRHLQAAKREGDVLVVTVTPDPYVNKGPGRPVFAQQLRAESLAAMECVDYVAINEWPTAVETIRLLRPDVYAKGSDYVQPEKDLTGKISEEEETIRSVGGRIHFTNDITFSSSHLINSHLDVFPPETEQWLRVFRQKHSFDEVIEFLDRAAALKVLVVGEAILDEYLFCDGLGKSTKDPVLATIYRFTEMYAGGSLAVANHLAGICGHVELITFLGEVERREDFIREALLPNVRPYFVTRRGSPTIHKRRLVDNHTSARLMELYVMDDGPLDSQDEQALLKVLREKVDAFDLVVVSDYGHGMLTPAATSVLSTKARFITVNTQANAGNRGFNTISKYPRADHVCLAMHEVALETRMRHADWRELVLEVTKRIDCSRFTVTQGKQGILNYATREGFAEAPALATKVADRVGAGDAVLAVISPLILQGVPWDVVGFVGNVAGSMMVAELGNRISVNRNSLAKHIEALMK